MNKILLFALCLLSYLFVSAQDIKVSGTVFDKNTLNPLPYISIQVENTGIGTASDYAGQYNLTIPRKYYNNKLFFFCMGYQKQEKNISEMKSPALIYLQQSAIELGEIIIMPDSNLRVLLKNAFNKIPMNYPDEPTMLKGFFRETLKTPENQYLYFAEAIIETYKTSYRTSVDNGQVKIIKSLINEFPGADTLNNVVFSGGIFSANNDDFVKKREDFINPRYFKRYNYRLDGITKYMGNDVYVIRFDTKNDTLGGTSEGILYIEQSSLAYIACVYEITEREIQHFNNTYLTPYRLEGLKKTVNYIKYKDKWHIKYIKSEQKGKNKTFNSKLEMNLEYITTEIKTDSIKPIPFEERIEINDIFSIKANDYYSDDYWSEYNVLEQDTLLKKQIQPLYTTDQAKGLLTMKVKQPKVKTLFKIAQNISTIYGITYLSVNANGGEYSVLYSDNNKLINFTEYLNPIDYNLSFNMQINYSLNKRWAIEFGTYKSLESKMYISSFDMGFSYKLLLNKKSKPLFLVSSLLFSYNNYARNFSKSNNAFDEFSFDGKTIDAEKIQFGIGQKKIGLKPEISFQYSMRRRMWLTTSIGYFYNLKTTDRLYLQEKTGFFITRKEANINLTDDALKISFNGEETTKSHITFNNYFFGIGLMWKF